MKKEDFISSVAERSGITKEKAKLAVDSFIDIITEELSKGHTIQLKGFGIFEVRERKEKVRIVPQTKEKVVVPATKVPAFKPGKTLKDAVSR